MARPGVIPLRAVLQLGLARARRRAASTLLSSAAIAAGIALTLALTGLQATAADLAIRQQLSTASDEPALVRVSRYEVTARDRVVHDTAGREAFDRLGPYAADTQRGLILRRTRAAGYPVDLQVLAVDGVASGISLAEGRPPAPCDGARCEAVLLSPAPKPPELETRQTIAGLEIQIVGRGLYTAPLPFDDLDQRGPRAAPIDPYGLSDPPSPAMLLLDGVDAVAAATALEAIPRTYLWTATVDVERIHPWSAGSFSGALERMSARLREDGAGASIDSPMGQITQAINRATRQAARLSIIGSLAGAILLAFAAFSALLGRRDFELEERRLVRVGATRAQRLALVLVEAGLPASLGLAAGLVGGLVASALLASAAGLPPDELIPVAVLQPVPLATAAGLAGSAAIFVALGLAATAAWRRLVGWLAVAAVTAVAILGWQLASSGPGAALSLVAGGPLSIILTPASAFTVALVALAVLPRLLRGLARRATRTPIWLRLTLVSLAREAGRPAVTIALLAFSLGSLVFAAGYRASLDTANADQAAYETGMDVRVREVGDGVTIAPNVTPVSRYADLGDGAEATTVMRVSGRTPTGGRMEMLGLDPSTLGGLRGWRADFADFPASTLGDLIRVDGSFDLEGQPLPRGERELSLDVAWDGGPLGLTAIVQMPDGGMTRVVMPNLRDGRRTYTGELHPRAVGGTIVAFVVSEAAIIAGEYHGGDLQRGSLTIFDAPGVVEPAPQAIELIGVGTVVLRPPQPADDLALPAVVSPDLARLAQADGTLRIGTGSDGVVTLRVAATASAFPTIGARTTFAVAAGEPLRAAVAAAVPGAGMPSEVWIRTPSPGAEAAVLERLAEPPFRGGTIESRSALIAARNADPLAASLAWALTVSGIVGLLVAALGLVLGALADLRDETGEMADLEAQGLGPAALRNQTLARTGVLACGGALAGLVTGVALNQLVTGALSLSPGATTPTPALVAVHPLLILVILVVGTVAGALAAVAALTRWTFRRAALGASRA